jgi:threonine dehydratase
MGKNLYKNILHAHTTLQGIANHTPILTSRTLDKITCASVFLKCENFQRVGAFKFRGAYNAISRLSNTQKKAGILTYSSGNHAQAVALVGKLLSINTTIVMPSNAPPIKKQATMEYGAKIITYNPKTEVREQKAAQIQQEQNLSLIPPFDHYDVIAGQGTAALETLHELKTIDCLLVPCGGGGLLSGSAIASKHLAPNCRVIGIEPEVANDAQLSFIYRKRHTIPNPPTIADGTRASIGKLTFPLILKYVDNIITVTEQEILNALKFILERLKIVVEPSGALGVAALLSHKIPAHQKIAVIISGGNIDLNLIKEL